MAPTRSLWRLGLSQNVPRIRCTEGALEVLRWLGKIMRNRDLVQLRTLGRVSVVLFALSMLVLTFAASAFAQTPTGEAAPTPPPATLQPSQQQLENWRKNMPAQPRAPRLLHVRLSKQPMAGGTVHYRAGSSISASARAKARHRGQRQRRLGPGVGPYIRSGGSFDSVTGVTSESGTGPFGGPTLSRSSSTPTSSPAPACSGAANPSNCLGWQQFVYANARAPTAPSSSTG